MEVKAAKVAKAKAKKKLWEVTAFRGECPRLQNFYVVEDNPNKKFYVYGTYCTDEEDAGVPKAYLYVCDTTSMEFTNLTNSLVFCPPGNPHSQHNLNRQCTPLPPLSMVGIIFFELNGDPMIFIFGGHDMRVGVDGPTSKLVAIDTLRGEWYYVNFGEARTRRNQAGLRSPANRIHPAIIGCNNGIYVFGGIEEYADPNKWKPLMTYSVAKFSKQSHRCEWEAVDLPYPEEVQGQVFGDGVAVNNGSTILLIPGLKSEKYRMNFKTDSFYYFLPINSTFKKVDIQGKLPKQIHWYRMCLDESAHARNPAAPPTVVICTWTPYGRKYLSPEIWRFDIYPEDSIRCLGFHKKLFDLQVNFKRFSLIGQNMYVMGQGGEDTEDEEGLMYECYIRIPL